MSYLYSFVVEKRRKLFAGLGVSAVAILVTLGVFAANDWLPKTDPLSGQKFGWFGNKLPKNAASSWNPLAAPLPSPTPQLSKEYIYAGSRLLAVEDANANAAPPADLAVWRPSDGYWHVVGQTGSAATSAQWGASTDLPVPGDYDADGKTDFAIYRPSDGYWWIFFSSTSTYTNMQWGADLLDTPAPADYDGDGKTDLAVARQNLTTDVLEWYISKSGGGTASGTFGFDNDMPGPADYDGDGKADIAVYRASNEGFYVSRSSDNVTQGIDLGETGDKVVSSDYDGDGKADAAVYNTSTAYWYVLQSTNSAIVTTQWGNSGDLPVQNDYDCDGKTDLATWRNSNAQWTIKRSSNGTTRTETFGTTGDIPVPAWYRR